VIAPYAEETVNWLPGRPDGTGPQFVQGDKRQLSLQVADLTALIAVAGRVPCPGRGYVVFETSTGLLSPEIV
jgi:hypothetical protein